MIDDRASKSQRIRAVRRSIRLPEAPRRHKTTLAGYSWCSAATGSSRAARFAGKKLASRPTSPRTSPAAASVSGSFGSMPKTSERTVCARARVSAEPAATPSATAGAIRAGPSEGSRPLRAEGHPDADLGGAPRDDECHDAVEAERREHQSQEAEESREHRYEAIADERAIEEARVVHERSRRSRGSPGGNPPEGGHHGLGRAGVRIRSWVKLTGGGSWEAACRQWAAWPSRSSRVFRVLHHAHDLEHLLGIPGRRLAPERAGQAGSPSRRQSARTPGSRSPRAAPAPCRERRTPGLPRARTPIVAK